MMRDHPSAGNMTGTVLVAHPNLRDPNFRRTILFLSHHSAEDGAIGLVLNRPLGQTLGECASGDLSPLLGRVPVFFGGPVAHTEFLLASVQWNNDPAAVAFRGFGEPEKKTAIPPEYQPGLRAFQGYSGWSRGQLEAEIAQKAWLILPPSHELIEMPSPDTAWRSVMRELGPIYRLLAEMPDDPSLN